MGGMGFLNPSLEAEKEYQNSVLATSQLTDAIYNQEREFVINEEVQSGILKDLQKSKESWWKDHQEQVQNMMNDHMKRVLLLASEKGASTWLTSLPLKRYGFRLNKQQFWDAVCI